MAYRPLALQFTAMPRLGGPGAPFDVLVQRLLSSPAGSVVELDLSDVNLQAVHCQQLLHQQQSSIQALRVLKLQAIHVSPAGWDPQKPRLMRLPHLHTLHVYSQHAALIIDQLLSHETPSLRSLLVADCPLESLFAADDARLSLLESFSSRRVNPELLRLMSARCGVTLRTLRVGRNAQAPQPCWNLLPTQFPALTSLRFRDDWWRAQEPTSLDWIGNFPQLQRLHLISPALFVGRFRALFGSAWLQESLLELHLAHFSAVAARGMAPENGPPSPDDFAAVWSGLKRMRRLMLSGCSGLPTMLRDLHLAPSLVDLCIAPRWQFTEVPLLRSLMLDCPNLHVTVLLPCVEKPAHWNQRGRANDQLDRRWVMAMLPCLDPLRFIPALEGRFHVRFGEREEE